MLQNIIIENFKPFGEGSPVRLAPITLIYGPNSSGKSSLIQSLLLLRQTLTEQGPRVKNDLVTSGSFTNLGSFLSLLHRHDPKLVLKLGFNFTPFPNIRPRNYYQNKNKNIDPFLGISLSFTANSFALEEVLPVLQKIEYKLIGEENNEIHFTLERMSSDKTGTFREKFDGSTEDDIEELTTLPSNRNKRTSARQNDFILGSDSNFTGLHLALKYFPNRHFLFSRYPERNERRIRSSQENKEKIQALKECHFRPMGLGPYGREYLPSWPTDYNQEHFSESIGSMTEVLVNFEARFRQTIGSLTYLGPLRTHPERLYAIHGLPEGSVGSQGEQAVQILYHDFVGASQNQSLIDKLNIYCEKFEIPYHFTVESIRNAITGDFVILSLTDRRTGVKVAPTDVGFGIGQILPILIEGMVAGDQGRYPRIVCVEQPEIHLHPRLQAAMADFFIDTAYLDKSHSSQERSRKRGVQWILETHSETLILRIQRRIREGRISAKDVSVLYVDPRDELGSVIEEIRIDDDGEFIDIWPDGFFAESFNELFGS